MNVWHVKVTGLKLCLFITLFLVAGLLLSEESAADNSSWQAIEEKDMQVQPGSALDYSTIFPPNKIDKDHRIRIGDDGHLAVAGKPVRLMIANMGITRVSGGFPDHTLAEQYADELKKRGYNMVRFTNLNRSLMRGRVKNFSLDPESLDRLYYLMYALKKRGIYWEVDVITKNSGLYSPRGPENRREARSLRLKVFYDSGAINHWKKIVDALLRKKNPYTNIAPLNDPALALITIANENDLFQAIRIAMRNNHSLDENVKVGLNKNFRNWLHEHGHEEAATDGIDIFEIRSETPEMGFLLHFISETEIATARWMRAYLKRNGYRGLITGYNNDAGQIASGFVRNGLDVVTMHAYHDHPRKKYSRTNDVPMWLKHHLRSSFDDNLAYVRKAAIHRVSRKPYIVDEYNHAYPNPWRFEAAVTMPAYGAFQGWDGIGRFDHPVELAYGRTDAIRHHTLSAFSVGMDPVARAGEALAVLLFRRGDVTTGKRTLDIEVDKTSVFNPDIGWAVWNDRLTLPALAVRMGVDFSVGTSASAGRYRIEADDFRKMFGNSKPLLGDAVTKEWRHGRYTTASGEIELDTRRRSIRIVTDRTEAVTFGSAGGASLRYLAIERMDGPGLIGLSSLDNYPLNQSGRMLLLMVSDAKPTDQVMHEKSIREHSGTLPILLKVRKAAIILQHTNAAKLRLYALNLRGGRIRQLPIKVEGDKVTMELDSSLQGQLTPFFEIVKDE